MPIPMELEPGNYLWCSCGKSKKSPLCDGAHKGLNQKPHKFSITTKQRAMLCNCQHTNKPPFCDGSHDFYK